MYYKNRRMLRYNYIIICCLFLVNVKSELFHINKLNSFKFHLKPKLISPQFTIAYCKDIINKEFKNEKNIRNNNINEEYNYDDIMMLDYIKINNNELKYEECLKLYESLELLGINAKNDSETYKLNYKYKVNDIEIKYLNIKNNNSNNNSNNKNIPYLNKYNNDLIFNESNNNVNNSETLFCNIIYNQRSIINITLDIENNNYIYTKEECIYKYNDEMETNYFQMIINILDDIIYEYDISLAKFWFTLFIMTIIRNS